MRAAPHSQPACTGWFVLYFGRVVACSSFLIVLSFLDFESSSRTDSDTFAVSIPTFGGNRSSKATCHAPPLRGREMGVDGAMTTYRHTEDMCSGKTVRDVFLCH
jgi:hypothetical protein